MSQFFNYGCLLGSEPIIFNLYMKRKIPAKKNVLVKMQFNHADNLHKTYASVVAIQNLAATTF